MKKKVFGRKLSRESDTRLALFRSLTASLVQHGKIVTTKAKALAIVPFAEKILRYSIGPDSLSVRRKMYSMMANNKKLIDSLIAKVNKSFSRSSRLTTLVNLPDRKGDSAKVVILSVVKGLFVEIKEPVMDKKGKETDKAKVKKVVKVGKVKKTNSKSKKK